MKLAMIGNGAIAHYARAQLDLRGHHLAALLLRPERVVVMAAQNGVAVVSDPSDLPGDLDVVLDCAGHQALAQYGPDILRRGLNLVTVSIGALADPDLEAALTDAARAGGSQLILASGAIGALDALRGAAVGGLTRVTYTGRKPPQGWKGSPAEAVLDLTALGDTAQTHFSGTAREAALKYPKNANVAAAVASAGPGFDDTRVDLVADPTVQANIHEIEAEGAFGRLVFRIEGASLPDNPRSSALAAMSVVDAVDQIACPVRF